MDRRESHCERSLDLRVLLTIVSSPNDALAVGRSVGTWCARASVGNSVHRPADVVHSPHERDLVFIDIPLRYKPLEMGKGGHLVVPQGPRLMGAFPRQQISLTTGSNWTNMMWLIFLKSLT